MSKTAAFEQQVLVANKRIALKAMRDADAAEQSGSNSRQIKKGSKPFEFWIGDDGVPCANKEMIEILDDIRYDYENFAGRNRTPNLIIPDK